MLHENCTDEYTLTATLAGTYSLAVVPVLQGAIEENPNALLPMFKRDVGSVMLERLMQYPKTVVPKYVTDVGIEIAVNIWTFQNAPRQIRLRLVGKSMAEAHFSERHLVRG